MERNCNLELHLHLPLSDSDYRCKRYSNRCGQSMMLEGNESQQHQEKLALFYNRNISDGDITELQARAIFSSLTSREGDDRVLQKNPTPSSTKVQSPLYNPSIGLSMRRSLQRFLQKRKSRIEAASPYNTTIQTLD